MVTVVQLCTETAAKGKGKNKKSIQKVCRDMCGENTFWYKPSPLTQHFREQTILRNLIGVLGLEKLTSTMRHVCY